MRSEFADGRNIVDQQKQFNTKSFLMFQKTRDKPTKAAVDVKVFFCKLQVDVKVFLAVSF
jgi:hypothetical protein